MGRVIQGYCLKPHTSRNSGDRLDREWKAEHLREATETLVGCDVTEDKGRTPHSIVGEVKYAEYVEGKGVRYEAEIFNEQAVQLIEEGQLTLAPRIHHKFESGQQEPIVMKDIQFDALFLTPQSTDAVPELGPPGSEPDMI